MNSFKGVFEDVLDPFDVNNAWFCMSFNNGAISANANIASSTIAKIDLTILRLKLNTPELCRRRLSDFYECMSGKVSQDHLKKHI